MTQNKKRRCSLAFSGGLDISFRSKNTFRKTSGYEVHTAIANTGDFSEEELKVIADKSKRLGAASHATLDITGEYYDKSIRYMIAGNILRNGTYPISVAPSVSSRLSPTINYAKKIGADAIAHGSTGAGNDQVRF